MIRRRSKRKNLTYEHLALWVKNTSYADRWKWLEQATEFVHLAKNATLQKGR
ncbi:MAG TPA: hypothetical protein VLJ10_06245 [Candidatus Bathyarchaeia archaeon]|nr:hypothetical protein [Candidatus Bathyarchaeia archaeon]